MLGLLRSSTSMLEGALLVLVMPGRGRFGFDC